MIAAGTPEMIPDLRAIWKVCFGDSDGYIDLFMARRLPTARSLVWLEGGRAVGMLYLLPCRLGEAPAMLYYAGGMLPAYRGRGIFPKLLDAAGELGRAEGAAMVMRPAPQLFDYYHRLGFTDCFWYQIRRYEGDAAEPCPVAVRPASPEEHARLRDRHFAGPGLLRWDVPAVAYALEENRFCGGFGDVLTWEGEDFLIFGNCEDGELFLREDTLPGELPPALTAALCRHYGAGGVRRMVPSPAPGAGEPWGVCLGRPPEAAGWLGLDLS